MTNKRPSVYDLQRTKGKRQLLEMHVDDELEAIAAEEAGMDMFTLEVDHMLPRIRAAAPGTFIQAGCRNGLIASEEEGIRKGFQAMEQGADAVYFSGSLRIVEAMAKEGIPVTGHIGLVPNWSTWTNYRAVGKTPEEAAGLFRKVKGLENAGAWAVEVEVVPVRIAAYITANTPLITEGMGCGSVCDAQYLFSCDVLGTNTGHYPKHSKKYMDMAAEQRRLQEMRIAAFKAFMEDTRSGGYPGPQHVVDVGDDVYGDFLDLVAAD